MMENHSDEMTRQGKIVWGFDKQALKILMPAFWVWSLLSTLVFISALTYAWKTVIIVLAGIVLVALYLFGIRD